LRPTSVLLLIGLFTRPVAFIMSGEMAVAYFMAHAPRGFFPILNQGELAILFCFVFLYLAAAGGGLWSIDAAREEKAGRGGFSWLVPRAPGADRLAVRSQLPGESVRYGERVWRG
jgi:hypothetical protein